MFQFPEAFVKPAEGRKVRLAGGALVPADGMTVRRNFLVEKLISIGDLVVDETKPAVHPEAAPTTTEHADAPAASAPSRED